MSNASIYHCIRMAAALGGLAIFANVANAWPDVPTWKLTADKADVVGGPAMLQVDQQMPGSNFLRYDGDKEPTVCQLELGESKGKAFSLIVEPLTAGSSRIYKMWPVRMLPRNLVVLKESAEGLEISVRGKPFTVYRHSEKYGPKPICWPILGPTEKPITRAYPLDKSVAGEARDHIHHRSMWFTHGKVGGNDFWSEMPRAGKQVHREFVRITSGPVFGEFIAKVDWIAKNGKKVCEDTRRMRVWATHPYQMFDFEIAIKASEGDLVFGDDKEGTFSFRVATSMDAKQKVKGTPGGTILNSNGLKDGATWGKRAAWVDYTGPVDGKQVGLTIFDSPKNFRHPTYWHVRDYGLFGANPFGVSVFENDKKKDGSFTVAAGGELRLAYRMVVHEGDAASAMIAEHFANYAEPIVVKKN